MSTSLYRLAGRVALCGLLVAAVGLPAQADTLVNFFGNAITSGQSPYSGPTLSGTIAYAVYTEANFESNFPGYDVPSGELGYIYQVLNGNGDPVSSNAIVGINSSITGIGSVTIDPFATEKAPQSATLTPSISAAWDFSGIGSNVPTLGVSNGLVLTSTHLPGPATTLNILVDGGASAIAQVVAPGDIRVPEPAGMLLAGLGATLLLGRRRRR
ncbi:MAG: PEP-CTERM sorting domain-containing protein [Pirellulales bacterium]